ncbi:MAG TPA: SCP2 sterol-binding domain-containing protein [Candidatus Dormibacteraeota bacterium]|nr:SCP2 sterol-binding domain-containing protein [Candidatus Dormibacteraeota bacterium]
MSDTTTTTQETAVRAVFGRLAHRRYEPRLHGTRGTYRFDIEGAGTWGLTIDAGSLTVSEDPGEADCVIRCGAADFVGVAEGTLNLIVAALQGRVRVTGDLALGVSFNRLLPVTP